MWLSQRIGEFLDLYPEIRVELVVTNEDLDLAMREAHVALRLRQPTQADLIQRRLFTVHFHAYASPDYIRRFGEPISLEDLDHHRLVASEEISQPTCKQRIGSQQQAVNRTSPGLIAL